MKVKLFFAFLAVLISWGSLSANYCFERKKFLSEQDYTIEAVRYFLAIDKRLKLVKRLERETGKKAFRHKRLEVSDAEVRDYLKQNPDCCFMGPVGGDDIPYHSWYTSISGRVARIVVINYKEKNEGDAVPKAKRVQIAVSKCGKARY